MHNICQDRNREWDADNNEFLENLLLENENIDENEGAGKIDYNNNNGVCEEFEIQRNIVTQFLQIQH